jgi:hypothetical protein
MAEAAEGLAPGDAPRNWFRSPDILGMAATPQGVIWVLPGFTTALASG